MGTGRPPALTHGRMPCIMGSGCRYSLAQRLGSSMYDEIKKDIKDAIPRKQKYATFQFHVLMNTENCQDAKWDELYLALDVPKKYVTGFTDMKALARVMDERGISLS